MQLVSLWVKVSQTLKHMMLAIYVRVSSLLSLAPLLASQINSSGGVDMINSLGLQEAWILCKLAFFTSRWMHQVFGGVFDQLHVIALIKTDSLADKYRVPLVLPFSNGSIFRCQLTSGRQQYKTLIHTEILLHKKKERKKEKRRATQSVKKTSKQTNKMSCCRKQATLVWQASFLAA